MLIQTNYEYNAFYITSSKVLVQENKNIMDLP